MLIHYLRSAWRTIRRNPFYSLINIGCLAIGIAVCMTVLLYILHEHSFDRWQKNARRIYGVTVNIHFGDGSFNTPGISYATGPLVRQADGNVEAWLRDAGKRAGGRKGRGGAGKGFWPGKEAGLCG